jgi:uncharacterized integral membrane protein
VSVSLPPVSEPAEREHETERAEPGAETRLQRGRRYGHRGRLYVTLIIGIAAIVFLILLIARNTREVKLDYVVDSTRTRLIWLVIVSAIVGWVLGIITSLLIHRRTRAPR